LCGLLLTIIPINSYHAIKTALAIPGINPHFCTYIAGEIIWERTPHMLNLKEKLANALALPKEIALDLPILTATGRGELSIENYKNLIEFSDTAIRIRTREGTILIQGERLILRQITAENLLIKGRVFGIVYE